MAKKILLLAVLAFFLTTGIAMAGRGKPNFGPSVYANGVAWGTKGTTTIPAPNDHNLQSFDFLYVITNGPEGQLPVSDAAPRDSYYNGGRWFTHTAVWNADGMAAHDPLPILRSYEELMVHYQLEHIDIFEGSPDPDMTPDYFQCPLLPVKEF